MIVYRATKNFLVSEVSIGTLNASLIHPREVFSKAILNNASHVVVAHNHPSGDSTLSDDDILTTKHLVDAGKLLGIAVTDHVIIAKDNYSSFAELHLL